MSVSRHNIVLSDIECMVLLEALRMYQQREEKHEIDKRLAGDITSKILDRVKLDKTVKPAVTYHKCGECKWLDLERQTSVGFYCDNPEKHWKSATAHLHSKSCKACKLFESIE